MYAFMCSWLLFLYNWLLFIGFHYTKKVCFINGRIILKTNKISSPAHVISAIIHKIKQYSYVQTLYKYNLTRTFEVLALL